MEYKFPKVHSKSKIGRAYEIIDTLNGGNTSDDNPFGVRLIIQTIESTYAKAVREDILYKQNSGEAISDQLYTPYTCLQMEVVDDDCNCAGTKCIVKRVKISTIAQYKGSPLIRNVIVGGVQARKASNLQSAKVIAKEKPFITPSPAYYLSGGYMYVLLPSKMQRVCAIDYEAVFETLESPDECDNLWNEFPMVEYLWETVKNRIRASDANAILNTMQNTDSINNGSPINTQA